jgi:hypothetical protein
MLASLEITLSRVEEGRGGGPWPLRFPSPLIKPDVRFSRILCGAPHKMRNVAAVVMWRRTQKAPSQGRETILNAT